MSTKLPTDSPIVAQAMDIMDEAFASKEQSAPIDMVLHCPACGLQHIDAADADNEQTIQPTGVERWTNPPHRSHQCRHEDGGCNHIWRPADVPTNGVEAVKTKGKADSPIAHPPAPSGAGSDADQMRSLLDEVRCAFTRDDGLPDGLLCRIDAALLGSTP